MSLKSRWRRWRQQCAASRAAQEIPSARPLREFLYLDEVSLRSLLVSQKDTIPEQVSRAISEAEQAELTGKVSAGTDLVGKAELGSRFQTSNSNSVQTSRKAIVQTLFNELREERAVEYALVVGIGEPDRFSDDRTLANSRNPASVMPASDLRRGDLVEIEVLLEVDPIFKIGTILSEIAEMAAESDVIAESVGKSNLEDWVPANKIFQRLLAGLVPIKARAANMSVVVVGGCEYVVHNRCIEMLDIVSWPLHVVGVTEHLGYWKDIRRVLFSSSPVTMLCRVGRSGLQTDWTPVKLADLFRDVAPELMGQLNEMGRQGFSDLSAEQFDETQTGPMWSALTIYRRKLEEATNIHLSELEEAALMRRLYGHLQGAESPLMQRKAFELVRTVFDEKRDESVLEASADLSIRDEAREMAGLELFPGSDITTPTDGGGVSPDKDERLLDVEVIAMYW